MCVQLVLYCDCVRSVLVFATGSVTASETESVVVSVVLVSASLWLISVSGWAVPVSVSL